jgi:hypothetical protein
VRRGGLTDRDGPRYRSARGGAASVVPDGARAARIRPTCGAADELPGRNRQLGPGSRSGLANRPAGGQSWRPTEPPAWGLEGCPGGGLRRSERAPNPPPGGAEGQGHRARSSPSPPRRARGSLRPERRSNGVLDVRNPAPASAGTRYFRLTAQPGGTRSPIPDGDPPGGKKLSRPSRADGSLPENWKAEQETVSSDRPTTTKSDLRDGEAALEDACGNAMVATPREPRLAHPIRWGAKTNTQDNKSSNWSSKSKLKLESLILAQSERLRRA